MGFFFFSFFFFLEVIYGLLVLKFKKKKIKSVLIYDIRF